MLAEHKNGLYSHAGVSMLISCTCVAHLKAEQLSCSAYDSGD